MTHHDTSICQCIFDTFSITTLYTKQADQKNSTNIRNNRNISKTRSIRSIRKGQRWIAVRRGNMHWSLSVLALTASLPPQSWTHGHASGCICGVCLHISYQSILYSGIVPKSKKLHSKLAEHIACTGHCAALCCAETICHGWVSQCSALGSPPAPCTG